MDIIKIAHRGYSYKYPENTESSFVEAIKSGADMIEFDIRQTKDNNIVIIHDDRINRTSNGDGFVIDKTLKELKPLNFGTPERHETLLTLDEAIDIMKGKVEMNIDVQVNFSDCDKLIETLNDRGVTDSCIVSSFNHDILYNVKGKVRTGLLYFSKWRNIHTEIKDLFPYSIHPHIDNLKIEDYGEYKLFFRDYFDLKVYPWGVKDIIDFNNTVQYNHIDGIMVDDLELFNNFKV